MPISFTDHFFYLRDFLNKLSLIVLNLDSEFFDSQTSREIAEPIWSDPTPLASGAVSPPTVWGSYLLHT